MTSTRPFHCHGVAISRLVQGGYGTGRPAGGGEHRQPERKESPPPLPMIGFHSTERGVGYGSDRDEPAGGA
jgi:hypothetical protein